MTKAVRENERNEAIAHLRKVLKPGDTVYTVLRHVSRSGMSRGIDCYIMDKKGGEPTWITAYIGKAIDQPQSIEDWRKSRGLRVGGCGMDMGFDVVYRLSSALYGHEHGYKCLGKGKCPSNYHTNHRDRLHCDGVPRYKVYWLNADGGTLQTSESFETREQAEAYAAGLPTHKTAMGGERTPEVEADYLRCWNGVIEDDNPSRSHDPGCAMHIADAAECTCTKMNTPCPICKGEGTVPNPDGPERFDLKHTDGYALRHKWL